MDHTYASSTVEHDHTGFDSLKNQILSKESSKVDSQQDIRTQRDAETTKKESPVSKKFLFTKGDQSLELDDDYEIEMMADKRPIKMTLRELKDRAAGDVAVKNRMHSLAEEKKNVQATFKKFAEMSRKDPLAALEFISKKANETDSDFEYSKYIEQLAEQAERLGKMDDKELKSWDLEKKLEKAEQDLSQRERNEAVVLRKQDLQTEYPEIGDSQMQEMVDAVLSNDAMLEGLEDEQDVLDKVEELIQETLIQRDIMSVIREINSDELNNNELIFSISDQIRQNPDLDEEDVREIVQALISPSEREVERPRPVDREREHAQRTLSSKARQGNPVSNQRSKPYDPYDDLKDQLEKNKEKIRKTPLYQR